MFIGILINGASKGRRKSGCPQQSVSDSPQATFIHSHPTLAPVHVRLKLPQAMKKEPMTLIMNAPL